MLSEFEYSLPKRTRPYPEKNYIASFYYAGGVRQNSTYENRKYLTHSIISDFAYKYNPKRSFGLGFDIIVDPSIKGQIIEDPNYQYNGFQENIRFGFHLSHDVYLSDEFVCLMQLGAYAYNKYNPSNKYLIYSRIGVRYIFEENFFANVILKSHTSVADYLEIGIGYRIKN